jgi:recombinational DNA repair ATPase RecF
MMYLSPQLRRDFLDSTLRSAFPEYGSLIKEYKKSLIQRNRLLKNISL